MAEPEFELLQSALRRHYFHELGALKLACLWLLEHHAEFAPPPKPRKRKTQ